MAPLPLGGGYTAVLPVRPWRLAPVALAPDQQGRTALARAFAVDVLLALRASPSVSSIVIVTEERDFPREVLDGTVTLLRDRGLLSADPINAAVEIGSWWAVSRRPCHPIVVVPADLPSITVPALEDALGEMLRRGSHAFVPDLAGSGSTLVGAERPLGFATQYGHASARHHLGSGFARVSGAHPRIRLDVDTFSDLGLAKTWGVGQCTEAALDAMKSRIGRDQASYTNGRTS